MREVKAQKNSKENNHKKRGGGKEKKTDQVNDAATSPSACSKDQSAETLSFVLTKSCQRTPRVSEPDAYHNPVSRDL